ncbi:transposase family protein [Streptomyces mexicanus]|uniref:transposase family protein n=1 Tax=Streptomyces mexicanus TaxID=178566 RepID=UPI003634E74B
MLDGTLVETDRCRVPGPSIGVDLWWSGKRKRHGGNIQVLCAPECFPLWTSPVHPGREHDMNCARAHGLLTALDAAAADGLVPIAVTGYEGAPSSFRLPHKKPTGGEVRHAETDGGGSPGQVAHHGELLPDSGEAGLERGDFTEPPFVPWPPGAGRAGSREDSGEGGNRCRSCRDLTGSLHGDPPHHSGRGCPGRRASLRCVPSAGGDREVSGGRAPPPPDRLCR